MGFGKLRWAVLLLPYFLPLGYSSANAAETSTSSTTSANILMNTVLLGSWDESYVLAHKVVSQMTVDEKVGVLTGVTFAKSAFILFLSLLVRSFAPSSYVVPDDQRSYVLIDSESGKCNGDTHPVPRLGIPALCFKDGPAGVQPSKSVTGFPAGINAASTFSRTLMRKRGEAIGRELKGKGVK